VEFPIQPFQILRAHVRLFAAAGNTGPFRLRSAMNEFGKDANGSAHRNVRIPRLSAFTSSEERSPMTPQSMLALWLSLVLLAPAPSRAQAGPDELAEAARLAAHARTLEDQCRYRESSEWIGKAIDRPKRSRSADASQARTAGSLLAELEIRHQELKQRPAFFDRQEQQITRLLAVGRAESADRVLRDTVPPACDARFSRLEMEIARRKSAARNLVRQGEEAVRHYDKKAALSAFQRAASLNVEAPGLTEGIQSARDLRGNHKALKILAAVLVTTALAGGGYYAYRQYEKRQAARSAAPPPLVRSPR
jgi:hypothetical protein